MKKTAAALATFVAMTGAASAQDDAATLVTAELTKVSGAAPGLITAGLLIWGLFWGAARLRRGGSKVAG